jgi:hypothetical protein
LNPDRRKKEKPGAEKERVAVGVGLKSIEYRMMLERNMTAQIVVVWYGFGWAAKCGGRVQEGENVCWEIGRRCHMQDT